MTDTSSLPFPIRGDDIVVDPKHPLSWAFELAANERVEITARGRWSTHPHGGPNFTGPAGDRRNLLGPWPEGCLVVSVYRGHIPLEAIPFTSDDEKVGFDGPAKVGFGAHDDPKGWDNNHNDPAKPMTATFKIFTR